MAPGSDFPCGRADVYLLHTGKFPQPSMFFPNVRVTPSLHVPRGRNHIYPLGEGRSNIPGTLFLSQSCHNYHSTPGESVFSVVTSLFSWFTITFYFPGDSNQEKKTLQQNLWNWFACLHESGSMIKRENHVLTEEVLPRNIEKVLKNSEKTRDTIPQTKQLPQSYFELHKNITETVWENYFSSTMNRQ